MSSLFERFYDDYIWGLKYRPQTIDELILPERLKTYFKEMIENRQVPNVILHGPKGSGKTSIAIILAETMDADVMYINGSKETSIDVIRTKLTSFCSAMSLKSDDKKIVIYDEGDGISSQAMESIKSFIEQFSKSASFIFISNHKHLFTEEMLSRLQDVSFAFSKDEVVELRKTFFKKVVDILKQEGVKFDLKVVAHIVKQYFPDMRKVLNELQNFSAQHRLEDLSILTSFNGEISTYYKLLREKDFYGIQEFCAQISDKDGFYTTLYDTCHNVVEKESLPAFVVLVNEYAVKSASVIDQRINSMALSIEIMNEIEFIKE